MVAVAANDLPSKGRSLHTRTRQYYPSSFVCSIRPKRNVIPFVVYLSSLGETERESFPSPHIFALSFPLPSLFPFPFSLSLTPHKHAPSQKSFFLPPLPPFSFLNVSPISLIKTLFFRNHHNASGLDTSLAPILETRIFKNQVPLLFLPSLIFLLISVRRNDHVMNTNMDQQ